MLTDQIRASVRAILEDIATIDNYRAYTGQYSTQLAQQLGSELGKQDVLLTCSGTAALELALQAGGIGPGDEVLLSAYDYPGNFWAIERCGARPVLLDIEPEGWRVLPQDVQRAAAEPHNIKALIVSHLHGQLQPMQALQSCCAEAGWMLVEDNCQALGARMDGSPTGTFGHFGIGSFGGSKVLSAGRGGYLTAGSEVLFQKAKLSMGAGSGAYAMSELQAAVVLAQLPWLATINENCREYFGELAQRMQAIGCQHAFPAQACITDTAFYQAGWLAPRNSQAPQREEMLAQLRSRGIAVGSGFPGFHLRSQRRCRQASNLQHTASTVERTWVIHYRQALARELAANELAEAIHAASGNR